MTDKLAAAMEDAVSYAMGIKTSLEMLDALATRFLANLAADLPDEMVEAGALSLCASQNIAPEAAVLRAMKNTTALETRKDDFRAALTAALTVETPRDDR